MKVEKPREVRLLVLFLHLAVLRQGLWVQKKY